MNCPKCGKELIRLGVGDPVLYTCDDVHCELFYDLYSQEILNIIQSLKDQIETLEEELQNPSGEPRYVT